MGTHTTRTVVWQGWHVEMPRRWDAVKLEGDHRQGYALFADAVRPRLGIRWQTPGRRFDPVKATTAAMREEVGRLAADEAVAESSDEWESPLLYVEPDPPGRDVWSAYSPESDRLIQVAYHAHRREHLLRTHLLPTLKDLPVDRACPWSVFDLNLLVPGDMALASQRLNSGDLGLTFEDKRTAFSIRQIAVASLAVGRKSLDQWVADQQEPLRGMYRASPVEQTSLVVGGRTCDARIGRMNRRRRYLLMLNKPKTLTTIAAHDVERDRLVILHGAQEGLLRAVAETVGTS